MKNDFVGGFLINTNRKLIVICGLLVLLFMVGSVSAASENTDNLQVANETDIVSTGEDTVNYLNTVEVSNIGNDALIGIDDSSNSLQATDPRDELQTLINGHYGEEITLQKNYVFASGTNNVGVNITGAITINGNGKTIDAAQTGRIFYITGENVVLKNIIFKNGKMSGHGAIINCNAKYLTVDHCDFYNGWMTGNDNHGGAIFFNLGYGNISYCNFENNAGTGGGNPRGGALYIRSGNMNINHTTFKNNTVLTADGDAGAIFFEGGYSNITYCIFESNACVDASFDIYHEGGTRYYYYNNTFKYGYGLGSTDQDGSSVGLASVSYSTFDHNIWIGGHAYSGQCGGLYVRNGCSNIYVTNNEFHNNTARNWGGGISMFPDGYVTNLVIRNNTFVNNTASYGGAIALPTTRSSITIEDCKFYSNTATLQDGLPDKYSSLAGCGGAIYANCYTELKDCVFDGNTATSGSGGAVYTTDVCSIKDSNFTSNNAAVYGGAIYDGTTDTTKTFTITGARFVNNHAGENGGALYLVDGAHVTYDNLYYSGNTAPVNPNIKEDGVVILIESMYVQVGKNGDGLSPSTATNWTYALEKVASQGTIYLIGGSEYTLTGLTITKPVTIEGYGNNVVFNANHAGRIFTVSYLSVTIKNIYFKNAYLTSSGSAIYWSGSNGILKNCTFDNCEAANTNWGGAVYWTGDTGTIDNCTFINNKATLGNNGDCGAIAWYSNGGVLKNSYFENNTGMDKGAAILVYNSNIQSMDIVNCTFNNNKADDSYGGYGVGGAIAVYAGSGVKIDHCNFTSNNATYGGGAIMYSESSLYGSVSNCNFIGNEAVNGGAIYWETAGGNVINCNFTSNVATGNGGAIYWNVNGGSITGSNFNNNEAVNGSAIYLSENVQTFEIKESTFTSNVASGYGTVAAKQLTTLSLGGNTFSSNSVSSGAVDYYFYDNTPTNITSSVIYVSQSSGSASNLGLTADSPTTFDHAYNDVLEEGGKIILLNEVFTDLAATIDKTVTIVGSGSTVISGGGTKRLFTITASGVTVENITFRNGKNSIGAAIAWSGSNGNLINCTFDSCESTANCGGTLYWSGTQGTVDKCTFINNKATYLASGNGGDAGAIWWAGDEGTIKNSYFKNNTCNDKGGAIMTYGSVNAMDIINCSFVDNKAETTMGCGGAICVHSGTTARINYCNFTSNKATSGVGGAIVINGDGRGNVSNCKFISNEAANGGAVYWATTNGNMSNCIFTNNVASGNGGAVYWSGSNGAIDRTTFETTSTKNPLYTTQSVAVTNSVLQNQFTLTKTGNINYGVDEVISGTFASNAPSSINIYLNGVDKGSVSVSSNSFSKTFSLLPITDYTVSFKDVSNNNSYTFTSGTSFTVDRTSIIYISPLGGGSGVSQSSPTTWEDAVNKVTSTGTIFFTAGNYDLYGKTISNAWTLKGSSASNVIINGNGQSNIFSIGTTGVKIYNLTLINTATKPITGSSVTVKDCVLENQIELYKDKESYVYGETITITGSFINIGSSKITAYSGSTKIGESSGTSTSYSISRNGNLAVGSYTLSATKKQDKRRIL